MAFRLFGSISLRALLQLGRLVVKPLQLFVVVFDTCLVLVLLTLPSMMSMVPLTCPLLGHLKVIS